MDSDFKCVRCDAPINPHRYEIGYTTCKQCGEAAAKRVRHTVVPMAKSNYIVVTDLTLLKQLNKYAKI
jgi:hypothetical protein